MDDFIQPMFSLVKTGLILSAPVALIFLVLLYLRGRRLPQCFSCGAEKVRPSRPMGLLEQAAGLFAIRPFRCEGCRERFFVLGFAGASKQRRGAVAIVFQLRDGGLDRVAIRRVGSHASAN